MFYTSSRETEKLIKQNGWMSGIANRRTTDAEKDNEETVLQNKWNDWEKIEEVGKDEIFIPKGEAEEEEIQKTLRLRAHPFP